MFFRTAPLVAFSAAALLLASAGCTPAPPEGDAPDEVAADVVADRLFDWLVGAFDSGRQAEEDPAYFAISLVACAVHAPEIGERVLYLEQAASDSLDRPYRQRLYAVDGDDLGGEGWTRIFALADEEAAVGRCAEPEVAHYAADEAELRDGCGVHLTWDDDAARFDGGTEGTGCSSTLGGASYATSEVTIAADRIDSWDRGFFADGEQAWGAVAGPYEFDRLD